MSSKKIPFDPDKLYQRALSLHNAGKLQEAESIYKMLLDFFPNQVEVITPFATLLLQMEHTQDGIRQLRRSLNINPTQPSALYNLGVQLQKQGELEEALSYYQQSLKLDPSNIDGWLNLGNTLKDLHRHGEAIQSFEQAAMLNPKLPSIHWNKALTQISMGNFKDGWELYEWGWSAGERGIPRKFSRPTWLGKEPISGKTILIYREQGLGDLIQFSRYLPMLEKLGARVILEAPKSLVNLMGTLSKSIKVIEEDQLLPPFDFVCPVMSLPFAFQTTLESIPANVPYLHVDEAKKKIWHTKLGAKIKPRIGLVWSGSMTNKIDLNPCARRNIPLEKLKQLFELPLEFHALQKEFRPEDLPLLAEIKNLNLHQDDLNDFCDTAALVKEMDLVISVCTSVAHLSGALNHPTWILLPYSADYRWMQNPTDSPWYPSVELIRQDHIGGYASQIKTLLEKLSSKFTN